MKHRAAVSFGLSFATSWNDPIQLVKSALAGKIVRLHVRDFDLHGKFPVIDPPDLVAGLDAKIEKARATTIRMATQAEAA